MSRSPDTVLARFSRVERWVHRSTAVLMSICLVTAFVLYYGPASIAVGHRHLVELVHVYSGFALAGPMLLGLGSKAYRSDLRRLNRFAPSDWQWLRSHNRRDGSIRVGKFNAGQKLNAALSCGSIFVLLSTGLIMYYTHLTRLSWRTGATFVHDWFALGVGLLVIGHITYALRDPIARRGMRTGEVPIEWARRHHSAWAEQRAVTREPSAPE